MYVQNAQIKRIAKAKSNVVSMKVRRLFVWF